jgi:hypothetical protein
MRWNVASEVLDGEGAGRGRFFDSVKTARASSYESLDIGSSQTTMPESSKTHKTQKVRGNWTHLFPTP